MKHLALVIIAVLFCGLLAACSGSAGTGPCSASNLVMGADNFCTTSLSIAKGSTLTFVDASSNGATHILIVGTGGLAAAEPGAVSFGGAGGHTMNPGDSWTTAPWNTPGVYHVTCTVHPTTMNLTVTVTG